MLKNLLKTQPAFVAFFILFFGLNFAQTVKPNYKDFVPKNFKIFEKSEGDLNGDKIPDLILIIKNTDKKAIVKDEYRGLLDRNRRGIIVLFRKGKNYELASKNYSCFSSENEDGGVYYSPELGVSAEKGKLIVHYAHGRYGYWRYTFRWQNSDFELIGYDQDENHGPVTDFRKSINFLTGKKLVQENTNPKAESGDEVFKNSWSKIPSKKLLRLSEIRDFDKLDF